MSYFEKKLNRPAVLLLTRCHGMNVRRNLCAKLARLTYGGEKTRHNRESNLRPSGQVFSVHTSESSQANKGAEEVPVASL